MNEAQLREAYKKACEGMEVPVDFIRIVSGIVWDTTITADERIGRIQILLQEASTTN
ncbi:hypothetical protein M5X06_22380 [Paenibacillus alvei]|uniref:Uncharacterized protein n=1 Tax=Paenibacillus alvei TaxID=44250 RepID=A0ABT4H2G6_PAEAL|nr:hypothetical protein [Paenibacillus alvei]MCY9763172.1 hypothetical protein [Paenibacillus alvei]MCY9769538.1 hypothetical protein [Paenibacillus alvei]